MASGLDINGCVLSYFEGTVIQAVHSLLYIVAECCHMKRYNKIFTKNVRGVLSSCTYSISQKCVPIASYTVFIAPYSFSRANLLTFISLRNIHSRIAQHSIFTHRGNLLEKCEVWHNIPHKNHLNLRLAHFNALYMEHISSLWTGIMAEYLVMSTSQGTYDL